jgi:hypothetical protein
MIRRLSLAALVPLGLLGCGSPPPPPAPPLAPAAPPRPTPVDAAPGAAVAKPLALIAYEPKGRRDPFEPLEIALGVNGLTVSSTRLTGIIWGQGQTLALLEGADGIGYILRAGDTLGDGRLVEIGADSAVFAVAGRPGVAPSRVTLRLRTDL